MNRVWKRRGVKAVAVLACVLASMFIGRAAMVTINLLIGTDSPLITVDGQMGSYYAFCVAVWTYLLWDI